jgi:HEAT repeat protein
MTLAHRIGCSLALLSLCVALCGCAGGGGGKSRSPAHSVTKAPPPVPPRVSVPVQPALQQQARTEMHRAAQQSTSPLVRAHALELMREAAPEEAPPYVTKGLDDQAAVVRFAAALAAGELKIDARDRLRQLALEDPDTSVQIAARFALHRLGDTSLSRELEKTARSENPRTRADTAMVLGLLGEKSGLNILRALRNDRDPAVRLQVAEAMWRLGDDQALEPLVAGTLSHYPDDQMMAVTGLAANDDRRVLEDLRGLLTTEYEAINLVTARSMGKLGSDDGYGVALRGAKSTDPKMRLLAALALGAIGRSDAQDELAILLRDANPDVRLAAAAAILQLK